MLFLLCTLFPSKKKKKKKQQITNQTTEQLNEQACAYLGAFGWKLTDQIFHLFNEVSLQPFFIITAVF